MNVNVPQQNSTGNNLTIIISEFIPSNIFLDQKQLLQEKCIYDHFVRNEVI